MRTNILAAKLLDLIEYYPGGIHRTELYGVLNSGGCVHPIDVFTRALHHLESLGKVSNVDGMITATDEWCEPTAVTEFATPETTDYIQMYLRANEVETLIEAIDYCVTDHSWEGGQGIPTLQAVSKRLREALQEDPSTTVEADRVCHPWSQIDTTPVAKIPPGDS